MANEVIVGADGLSRCAWIGSGGNNALIRYHDDVWGSRTYEPAALFEALTLGVFEVGLSWAVVFGKRDGFRTAFEGFDPTLVAAMGTDAVDRLVQDPSIIRNRRKIEATVENARVAMAASPSLAELARSYAIDRRSAPRASAVPSATPQSQQLADQLRQQGYRFIGPTSVYAFMQNVGIVNDHVRGCFRAV